MPTANTTCPHCGHDSVSDANSAVPDRRAKRWAPWIAGFVGLLIVGAIVTEDPAKREAREKQRAEVAAQQKRAADAKDRDESEKKLAEQRSGFHCLSGWDGHSRQVKRVMEATLRDPDSFEEIETRITPIDKDGKHALILKYRARNGFGGMNVGTALFSIDGATCAATLIGNQDQ